MQGLLLPSDGSSDRRHDHKTADMTTSSLCKMQRHACMHALGQLVDRVMRGGGE
jgi:hypothetical protein